MKKITKREVVAFVLGIVAMFLIESIVSWDDTVKSFNKGWDDAHEKANKIQNTN
jgi:hypothetical protein